MKNYLFQSILIIILFEELLIPINLDNHNWILVTIDVKHHCYYAINPYNPLLPSTFELSIASFITEALSRKLNLQVQKFTDRSPNNVHHLPIQLPSDTINCGVYVSMYLVIYAFGTFQQPYIGNLLIIIPNTIDECRGYDDCMVFKRRNCLSAHYITNLSTVYTELYHAQ